MILEDVIRQFQADGAVCLRQVFSPFWVEQVKQGIARNLENPSPFGESLRENAEDGIYFNDYFNWKAIPEFHHFIFDSPVAELVKALMQTKSVTFYHEHVLVKDAGASKKTPWHQDQSYYPFNGNQACSVWMPVDPILPQTTLKFVKGSHKHGWFYPRKFATSLNYPITKTDMDAGKDLNIYEDVPSEDEISKMEILEWTMEPGDCLVFHMKALHGADGNTTTIPRRILSTRWFGGDVVRASRNWEPSPPFVGSLRVGDHPSKDPNLFPVIIP